MESTNTANPSESLAQKAGHVSTSILIPEKTLTVPGPPAPKQKYPFLRPRKLIFFSLLGVGAIALAIFVYRWWHYAQTHQETENAYISGHVVPVTTRISGKVMQVLVNDNQNITQGSLLLKLDPSDIQVSLQQDQETLEIARQQVKVAKTNIDVVSTTAQGQRTVAQGNISAADANIETAQAALAEAQARVPANQAILSQTEANLDYQRYKQLYKDGAVSKQKLEFIKASYQSLLAQRNSKREQILQAQAAVAQAQKKLDSAQVSMESSKGSLQHANATGKHTQAIRRQYQAALAAISQAQSQVRKAQFKAKRLTADQAKTSVAKIIKIQNTAMDTLAREELGIHIDELYESPCSAAMTLFYLCRIRAIIPFSIYFLSTGRLIGNVSILASRLVRFIIATGLRCEAKRSMLYSETRQRVFSIVEAASTFGDRRLIWTTQTRMVGEFS